MLFFLRLLTCASFLLLGSSLHATQAPLTIGVIRPASGPMKPFGDELVAGIELAIEDFKASSQKHALDRHKIELVFADDAGKSSMVEQAFKELTEKNRPHVLIGSVSNSINQKIRPLSLKAKKLTILPTSDGSHKAAKSSVNFTVQLGDFDQGLALGQFAASNLKKKSGVIFVEKGNTRDETIAKGIVSAFKKITKETPKIYGFEDPDKLPIGEIKISESSALFFPGFFFQGEVILKNLAKSKKDLTVIGSDKWDTGQLERVAGEIPQASLYFYAPFSLLDPSVKTQNFVTQYRKAHTRDPGLHAFLGYEAATVLLEAYEKTKSNRLIPLRKYLGRTKKITTSSGNGRFTKNNFLRRPAIILTQKPKSRRFVTKVGS